MRLWPMFYTRKWKTPNSEHLIIHHINPILYRITLHYIIQLYCIFSIIVTVNITSVCFTLDKIVKQFFVNTVFYMMFPFSPL